MLLSILGCASAQSAEQPTSSSAGNNAIVIRNAQISGSVLEALRTHIPSVRITTPTGECPRIIFRGDLSGIVRRDPSIYVDKTLMGDTCILNSILAQDVDYIEVYPSGQVADAAIRRNPAGVIVIYRRKE